PSASSIRSRSVSVFVEIGPSRRFSSPNRLGPSRCSLWRRSRVHGLDRIPSSFAKGSWVFSTSARFCRDMLSAPEVTLLKEPTLLNKPHCVKYLCPKKLDLEREVNMQTERPLRESPEFAGKRVLVTGGTKGIGAAVVKRLASGGARVLTT